MKRYVAAAARPKATYDSEGLVAAVKDLLKTIANDFGAENYEIVKLDVYRHERPVRFFANCHFSMDGVLPKGGPLGHSRWGLHWADLPDFDVDIPTNVDIPVDYYSSDPAVVAKAESNLVAASDQDNMVAKWEQLYAEFVDSAERIAAEYGCAIRCHKSSTHDATYYQRGAFDFYVTQLSTAHGKLGIESIPHSAGFLFPQVGPDDGDRIIFETCAFEFKMEVDLLNTDTIDETPIYEFFDKLSAAVEAADAATDEMQDVFDQSAEYCAKFESDLAEYDIECQVHAEYYSTKFMWSISIDEIPSVITPKYELQIYSDGNKIRTTKFTDYRDINWNRLRSDVVRKLKRKAAEANAPAPSNRYRSGEGSLI